MLPESINLISEPKDIEQLILSETDLDNLNDIINLFNISLRKRDLVRNSKLSETQDKIVEQISNRVAEQPDNFSNDDLLKYYKTIQDSLVKSNTSLDDIKTPTIQLNQQININNDEFDRESRMRIIDTVSKILNLSETDVEVIDDWYFDKKTRRVWIRL